MSTWLRRVSVLLLLAAAACKIPYPIVTNAGGAVVPPSADHDPLGPGAGVKLVFGMPPTGIKKYYTPVSAVIYLSVVSMITGWKFSEKVRGRPFIG